MKQIFTLCSIGVFALFSSTTFAQLSSGGPAKFGIDGDVQSNYRLVGSWSGTATQDWFKNSGTTAIGVIDTTGAAAVSARLLTGENYAFDRGMSVPRYSVQDGYLVLDARYARDNFGFSASGPTSDLTTFGSSQKNGFNPSSWVTAPLGGAVADKSDIIDAYVHMRRDGSVVSGASSSHLIAVMGATTASNNGTRFFDVEFFCTNLSYSSSSGAFSNAGPAATGGHTVWTFNADGSVKTFGDMSIAFSFTGSDVSEISIWVWVSYTNFLLLNPAGFDFVSGEFYGAAPLASYGYAKIKPNSGNFSAWGAVNTSATTGPAWGTCSKSLGANGNNYDVANYDVAQLGEAAIDLTTLGIDPALLSGGNACNPPFKRVLIKSRSSSTFTSALQDFAGPYEFLDAPTASAAITPATLSCRNATVTLQPQSIQSGNYYQWSTSGGNILTNSDSTYISINKPGKYYLQSSIYKGCTANIDSVIISKDSLQPVATASTSGMLSDVTASVLLYGGDPVASNVATSFGSSMGLTYSWTGPSGFVSTQRNPSTSQEGNYQLIVTEIRNGCTDTAATTVLKIAGIPLPVKLTTFQGSLQNNRISLNWTDATNETADKFEVERSVDGMNFITAGIVFASSKAGAEEYLFYESANNLNKVYYRLKMYGKSQSIEYSKTLVFQRQKGISNAVSIAENPVTDKITIRLQSELNQKAQLRIFDYAGRLQMTQTISLFQGSNIISLPLKLYMTAGAYIVELSGANNRFATTFIKQ